MSRNAARAMRVLADCPTARPAETTGRRLRNRRYGRRNVTLTSLRGRPAKGEAWVSIYQGRAYAALLVLLAVVAVIWAFGR